MPQCSDSSKNNSKTLKPSARFHLTWSVKADNSLKIFQTAVGSSLESSLNAILVLHEQDGRFYRISFSDKNKTS